MAPLLALAQGDQHDLGGAAAQPAVPGCGRPARARGSAHGDCTTTDLIAKINAANNTTNPEGQNTLSLNSGCTYTLTAVDNWWYGPNALPAISSDIVIEGNGAVIESTATTRLRFFFVGASTATFVSPGAGTLTLRNVTLRGGRARGGDASGGGGGGAGMGGAIFNQGALTLERGHAQRE